MITETLVAEVEPAAIASRVRKAVEQTLDRVLPDLGLLAAHVRWFKTCPGGSMARSDDLALVSLMLSAQLVGAEHIDRFNGHANAPADPPVVWLRADLPPHVAAYVAAHEARHLWQYTAWDRDDDARHEQSEEDADAYAFRAPWPARFRDAIANEPMLKGSRRRASRLRS